MIVNLYSIKDKLTGFGGPIAFKEDKIAERWFEAFCRNKKETEYTDAKYYELYLVGSMDTEKGNIIGTSVNEVKLIKEGEAYDE